MEAENTLTLPQEAINEIFFREEVRRLYKAFPKSEDTDQLRYLRNQLQCMKSLLAHLALPWRQHLPLLFRSFTTYMRHPDEFINDRKTYQNATQLMDSVSYLSQQGAQINNMITYFDQQIKELDALIARSAPDGQ
ncbi:hypothetical protein [Bacteroides sp.]